MTLVVPWLSRDPQAWDDGVVVVVVVVVLPEHGGVLRHQKTERVETSNFLKIKFILLKVKMALTFQYPLAALQILFLMVKI